MAIGRVVVGLDGSSHAAHALTVALALLPPATEFIAVHAYNAPGPIGFSGPIPFEATLPTMAVDLSEQASQWRQDMEAEMKGKWTAPLAASGRIWQAKLVDGFPSDVLLAAAQESSADLIVLGHPAHGALAEAVLGSVGHELLRRAQVPVLLIPALVD